MDRSDNTRRTILLCVLLGAVTLASYWPVLRNDFVSYDDPDYVSENPYVLRGLTWQNSSWAFETVHSANWHPLTWLSHMLDVQLFGLQPAGHHLTNLLLHTANTLLLFLALQRMTRARWRSALVAALFALHPLHVESVAWVAERKDVLSGFFFMLTLWAYARYATRGQRSEVRGQWSVVRGPWSLSRLPSSLFYLLSLCFFALGLMSKAMLVTLPFVLLLLDYWPLQCFQRAPGKLQSSAGKFHPSSFILHPLLLEKLPFFALAAASSAMTFATQQNAGAVRSLEAFSPGFRIANALVAYGRYLGKMIWPANLACFYPAPTEWPLAWVLGATLLLAALTALCVWQVKRAPYLAVGWFWYLGMLVPVIGIVQVGMQSMADRYTYLPLIGVFIAVVWAAAEGGSRRKAESRKLKAEIVSKKIEASITPGSAVPSSRFDARSPEPGKDAFHRVPDYARSEWDAVERVPTWLMGAAMVALLLCGYLTWRQTGFWRTSTSLFAHAVAVTRDNEVAQNNLGTCLLKGGNVAAAEPHFVEALRIKPRYADALANLASCRSAQGRVPEAIDCFQRALDISPAPVCHYDLANLLRDQGRLAEAEAHYQAALRLRPYFVEAWYNLGGLKQTQGDAEAAARDYTTALQFRPDHTGAHLNLGQVLALQHKWDEAIAHLRTGLRAAPQNAEARFYLGAALASTGKYAEAEVEFTEACRLRPEYGLARERLGEALFHQGKLPEAVSQLKQALQAGPGSAMNHYYLALALHAQGQFDEALPHYREAARLDPNKPLYLNDLAWILATHPRAELRDGAQAVRLAEAACRLTEQRQPLLLGTLAAAYAETGRFADAVKAAEKAIDLAAAAGLKEVAERNRQLLELYRAGKPFHEPEARP